jgi:hypothetical protein
VCSIYNAGPKLPGHQVSNRKNKSNLSLDPKTKEDSFGDIDSLVCRSLEVLQMISKEAALLELGVSLGSTESIGSDLNGARGLSSLYPGIPALSAFGEFTPITVRSYTSDPKAVHANMERNQR